MNSPLFDPAKTPLLSKAKFRNIVLQEIIQLLSLSRETKRSKFGRGRISYAQLGINQLGAVYEGLLSYTGFFAQETLYEVKPAKVKESDEMGQTYFIPAEELDRYEPNEFIYIEAPDGTKQRKSYDKGTFIFRLAGRDREKSASYYTPEVLTQCVVKYTLKELLNDKTADDILKLTICEPAMGSGAFINEAVNQLADAYLERKQEELGERIAADEYRHERQKVKYFLATNNAYGVDLNPTAVELAKVSLWLNIIYDGAKVPWFGPRLAVGNSLIGARRQVYSAEDVLSGEYKKKAPEPVPLGDGEGNFAPRPTGTVYHWLLPDEGMAAFDKDKVIKELAPTEVQAIKDWRKKFTKKITQAELKNLQALSDQADSLWQAHLRERLQVLSRTKEEIGIWGQPQLEENNKTLSIAGKEKELAYLERPTSPYRRLKLAMDYWCALWFWPIKEAANLPERQSFWNELHEVFKGVESDFIKPPEQLAMWEEEILTQSNIPGLATPSIQDLVNAFPRLETVNKISSETTFNHWELAFPDIINKTNGFDLVLGNPPWVKIRWSESGLLSEYEPLIIIRKLSSSEVAHKRNRILNSPQRIWTYIHEFAETEGTHSFLSANTNFPYLNGVQSNSYKCFIGRAWELGSPIGIIGFLFPEGVYEDVSGGFLRTHLYNRLISHFMFQNELLLFSEIGNRNRFGVNIYRSVQKSSISFDHIVNLFHPRTVDECYRNDGYGLVPGIKNHEGNWDFRGHRNRIIVLNQDVLETSHKVFEKRETPQIETRLPIIHSQEILKVLNSFAAQKVRLEDYSDNMFSTRMWDETAAQREGFLKRKCQIPSIPREFILSGPHFYLGTLFYQTPNEGCKSHRDYSYIDLKEIQEDYLPRAVYSRSCKEDEFENRVPRWNGKKVSDYYRFVARTMLSQSGERTMVSAISPPDIKNINTVYSLCFSDNNFLAYFSGLCMSLPYDFFIKVLGKGLLETSTTSMLPVPDSVLIRRLIVHRTVLLNCISNLYTDLWKDVFNPNSPLDRWSKKDSRLRNWSNLSSKWDKNSFLQTVFERRQALIEIDVLGAMALNLTLKELLTIFRIQFPVLQKNEKRLVFDQRGYKVPVKTMHGELVINEDHEDFPEMVPPFTPVDREADYRQAWAFFEKKLKEENETA